MLPQERKILEDLVTDYEQLCDVFCLHPEKYEVRHGALYRAKTLLNQETNDDTEKSE